MRPDPSIEEKRVSLARLVGLAFVTGALGFGGGWAVVARVRRAIVEQRAWIAPEEFLHGVAVASALPGTTAANIFSIVGYRLWGVRGAVASTLAFLTPSAVLMASLGALYDRGRGLAIVRTIFEGMNPAVVGIVAAIAVEMRRDALLARRDWVVAAVAAIALMTHALTLIEVVVLAGILGVLGSGRETPSVAGLSPLALAHAKSVGSLFVVFAKIGAVTFGGGFAIIPAIAREAIGRGWVDAQAFADAVALGQITPGPVAITATFIGYRAAGWGGALAATLGMTLPPLVICIVAARSLAAFRTSTVVAGFLRGIAPAVVGIIVAASYWLGASGIHGALGVAIAVASFALRVRFPRTSPLIPIVLGALAAVVVARLAVH